MSEDGARFTSDDYTERHADVFEARYRDGRNDLKIEKVLSFSGVVDGLGVLDVGCGTGFFAAELKKRGARVVACDFAESMVGRTADRHAGEFPILRASAEELPLEGHQFELVLALDVIEHLYHPKRMLAEVSRVLRPGGRLLVTTDRVGFQLGAMVIKPVLSAGGRVLRAVGLYERFRPAASPWATPRCTHVYEYDMSELVEMVTRAGFTLGRVDTYPIGVRESLHTRLVEFAGQGPFKRYKWDYGIYEFVKPVS